MFAAISAVRSLRVRGAERIVFLDCGFWLEWDSGGREVRFKWRLEGSISEVRSSGRDERCSIGSEKLCEKINGCKAE